MLLKSLHSAAPIAHGADQFKVLFQELSEPVQEKGVIVSQKQARPCGNIHRIHSIVSFNIGSLWKVRVPNVCILVYASVGAWIEACVMTTAGEGATEFAGEDPSSILLVDDDENIRVLLLRCLRSAGYQVATACSATEALTILHRRDEPIQLLITDLDMPGISGLELAVRVEHIHPECLVLLMSGSPPPLETDSREWNYLAKPFSPHFLLGKVRALLESRKRGRNSPAVG
jgi:CheY-like chemotaxis protein